MPKRKFAQYLLALFSVAATAVLARGVASAAAEPGSAESSYESNVEVNSSGEGSVTVTSEHSSTTTVGSSSDGTTTTPEISTYQTSLGTAGDSNPSLLLSEGSQTAGLAVSQNDQTGIKISETNPSGVQTGAQPGAADSGPDASAVPGDNHTYFKLPKLQANSSEEPAPVTPAPDHSSPLPASSNSGTVTPVVTGSGNGGGKGAISGLVRVSGLRGAAQVAFVAFLLLLVSCFISYLRRSGFQHAPRSDASALNLLFFATPRVEMQTLPLGVSSAFFVASDNRQLTILGRR